RDVDKQPLREHSRYALRERSVHTSVFSLARRLHEPRRFIVAVLAGPNAEHAVVARGVRDDPFDRRRIDPSDRREYLPLLLAWEWHELIIEQLGVSLGPNVLL